MSIARPPCWPEDRTKPNPCALAHYARVVDGHAELTADWLGWAGNSVAAGWFQRRSLAAGTRRTPDRADWQAERFGSRAG